MTDLTHRTFEPFVKSHKFVVVHFWAPWNGIDAKMKTFLETEIPADLPESIAFARIDTDPVEHTDLCRSHRVLNLPLLEFYRDGSLVDTFGGFQKDKIIDKIRKLVSNSVS